MMTRVAALLACLALSFVVVRGGVRADEPGKSKSPSECVVVTPTAPFVGYAYNHVLEVKNGCERPVSCELWTNVDPTPHHRVSLKPGETTSLLVRRGSPVSAYQPGSDCKY